MENQGNIGDNVESSTTQTTNRLSNVDIENRVAKCGELRYKAENGITQAKWIEYCKEHYGDKSVPTYLNYWMKAKDQYEEVWRNKLEGLLHPAQEELRNLLMDNNPAIRQKAIDQIMKYSGNDVQKHLVAVQQINLKFGEEV